MIKRIQNLDLVAKKAAGEKISMLTVYDYPTAQLLDRAGIDILFVGDSVGNTFSGHDSTIPVTVDDIIYHTKAIKRGSQHGFILADMPFLSYQVSLEDARANAGRLVKEGGAQGVKLETNFADVATTRAIVDMGIPVMGHIGLTPQSVNQLGGYKLQGADEESAQKFIELAKALEHAGCFGMVLEKMPSELAQRITEAVSIPTIGIGAGPHCDGQVLVLNDMIGLSGFKAKFVKQYATVGDTILEAVQQFKNEVESGIFPSEDHSFTTRRKDVHSGLQQSN